MERENYRRVEMQQDIMQVILEFPTKQEDDGGIKEEVKQILIDILQDYITKNS